MVMSMAKKDLTHLESLDIKYRKQLCDLEFLLVKSQPTISYLDSWIFGSILALWKIILSTSSFKFKSNYFIPKLKLNEVHHALWKWKNLRCCCSIFLNNFFSCFDLNHILQFISRCNYKKITKIKNTKNRKIVNLGLTYRYDNIDPNKD